MNKLQHEHGVQPVMLMEQKTDYIYIYENGLTFLSVYTSCDASSRMLVLPSSFLNIFLMQLISHWLLQWWELLSFAVKKKGIVINTYVSIHSYFLKTTPCPYFEVIHITPEWNYCIFMQGFLTGIWEHVVQLPAELFWDMLHIWIVSEQVIHLSAEFVQSMSCICQLNCFESCRTFISWTVLKRVIICQLDSFEACRTFVNWIVFF